jgi:hypothetical protein
MLAFTSLMLFAEQAAGHDQWANGSPVPSWVKAACCGPDEAHRLTISQVRKVKIEGIANVVPDDRVFPSQDGWVWGFWSPEGKDAFVQCLFIPESF